MTSPENSLDRPARRGTVHRLAAGGYLGPEARDEALRWLEPRLDWWAWANRALLLVGSCLLLSGIVFFFAFNWAEMRAFLKFALIELAMAGCLLAAWRVGIDRLGGKVLLLSASFLVGVFLAVYGQVYQTGADAYELFAGWAALIAGWVFLSRFAGLWVTWLALVQLAITLFWRQNVALEEDSLSSLCLVLAGVNGVALAAREIMVLRGTEWASPGWVRWILWAALLGCLTIPTSVLILLPQPGVLSGVAAAALIAALGAGYALYRYRSPDLPALTLGMLNLCGVVLTFLGKALFEIGSFAGMFLLFGFVILGVVGAAMLALIKLSKAMGAESHG